MSNVVGFPKAERLIFTCGHCTCSSFYLYDDGSCECAGCNFVSDGGEWVTPLRDKPKYPEKDDGNAVNTIAIGSVEFARRRVVKRISDEHQDLAFVSAWFDDGSMISWSGADTEEQRDFIVRHLRELASAIEVKPIPEPKK